MGYWQIKILSQIKNKTFFPSLFADKSIQKYKVLMPKLPLSFPGTGDFFQYSDVSLILQIKMFFHMLFSDKTRYSKVQGSDVSFILFANENIFH